MTNIKYYREYLKGGLEAVVRLANKNKIKSWGYCLECDTEVPTIKKDCLVCGQKTI